jgi:hypothetical protein
MADGSVSWLKHLETWSTLVGALGSVAVPIMLYIFSNQVISQQHNIDEQNTERSLVISVVGYLCDDSPTRRQAGFTLVNWLKDQKIEIPPAIMIMAIEVSQSLPPTAAADVSTAPAPAPSRAAAPSAPLSTAQAASDALGGLVPRIFIHVASEEQQSQVAQLRNAIQGLKLSDGSPVLVPGVEQVAQTPDDIELRVLKKSDLADAPYIAQQLRTILGAPVNVRDFTASFDRKRAVKARTYELWLPATLTLVPTGSSKPPAG